MQAEVEVLGVHHGELGGLIARHWNLPERLAEAIAHHHAPEKVADVVCDAVHVANIAARLVAGPPPLADADVQPSPGAVERLRLPANFLDRLTAHVGRRLEDVLARYDGATEPIRVRAAS